MPGTDGASAEAQGVVGEPEEAVESPDKSETIAVSAEASAEAFPDGMVVSLEPCDDEE